MRITKKWIHHVITGLLLVAPLVYLFGSLFTGLNGAHGDSGFSADYELITSYDEYTNNQLLDGSLSRSYTFNGISVTSVDGIFDIEGTADASGGRLNPLFSGTIPVVSGHIYYFVSNGSFDAGVHLSRYTPDDRSALYSFTGTSGVYLSTFTGPTVLGLNVYIGNSYSFSGIWFNMIDLTLWFGGNIPSDYVSLLPTLPLQYDAGTFIAEPVYTPADYTDFIFNQFFQKDNFVSQIGRDAISESPHGFVPFAQFLSFIDGNMLHIGETHVGLMAYGYFYWCAHVLLLVLVFDLTTFFIQWVSRIARSAEDKSEVGL